MTRTLRNSLILALILIVGTLPAMAQGIILPPPGVDTNPNTLSFDYLRVNTTINCLIFILAFLVQWLFGVVVGLFPADVWDGPRFGYQVALAGLLALHLLSFLPLALRGGRRPGHGE